jgi:cysteine-rich repeat protein
MTRHSNVTTLIVSTFFVSLLLAAGAPQAQAQLNKAEQTCVNAVNKAGAKVAATQGKDNAACVKAGGSGNLDNPTVDACIAADNKGKVAGAQTKTTEAAASKCPDPPSFGFSSAATVNAAAENEEVALAQDIFGNPVDPNILTDKPGATCQSSVIKSYEKLASTRMKAFNACKKTGFKESTVNFPSQLQACMSNDPKNKVDGAAAKLASAVTDKCAGVPLATAFPGCSAEVGAMAACIERKTECRMCLMTNAMDNLAIPCDAHDDGVVNQTCRQCGNGAAEAPEPCDTAGDSMSCDFDCTIPACGDSHTNVPFGEACDAGAETAGCDDDCSLPVCGDGNHNALAGEACDDGNLTDGDGCDSNCTLTACGNGIPTGIEACDDGNAVDTDACRNSCALATCGDGVTCSGAGCTSGPSGGLETCDDGNGSNSDNCLTTCAAATCSDGFVCNSVGCTSGPGGGLEQCDNAGANSNVTPDACRTDCRNPFCGDGVDDTPEGCDDGNAINSDACLNSCVAATCGDGVTCTGMTCTSGPTGGAEACDDANGSNTDPCRTNCAAATCGDGFLCNSMGCTTGPSGGVEVCDNAGANSNVTPDACRTTCRPAFCGDNVTDTGETCDTAGNSMACDSDCTTAACGDGFINPANNETCDTSGESMTCDINCTSAICGDGYINVVKGENCDDGNAMSGDGCSSTCMTGPGSGEHDSACPDLGELTLYSKMSNQACTTNGDCTFPRFCNTALPNPRCETIADLDSGWNGAGHDSDINDSVTATASLLCEGPAGPGCGECEVTGISPEAGNCRCANSIATICDQPFVADNDDCGGAVCNCYFGAPFPLSAQGTPVCVSNRFSEDIFGTADPDLGAGEITANLRAQVFLGYTRDMPCPVCGGKCSNDNSGCIFDDDCDGLATCVQDTPGDGIRDGQCVRNPDTHVSDGVPCEIDGVNASFPALIGTATPGSGGAGYSIDCQPDVGKNVSGAGLKISLQQTTGLSSLGFGVDCNGPTAGTDMCPCLVCSIDTTQPCDSDGDCAPLPGTCAGAPNGGGIQCTTNSECTSANIGPCGGLGVCNKKQTQACSNNSDCLNHNVGPCALQTCTATGANGVTPQPNFCTDDICTDQGGGEGTCLAGPNLLFCDGLVKANGGGASGCLSNSDCVGGYGVCTVTEQANCFLDPIVAIGVPDPEFPIAGATFCIAPTSNPGVNSSAGLPGPGRVLSQGAAATFCANDHNVQYSPGGIPACP